MIFILFISLFLANANQLQAPQPYKNSLHLPINIAQHEIRFPESYTQAREEFIQLSKQIKKDNFWAVIGSYFPPSNTDPDLSTDYLYIPRSKRHLVIITSGLHGAEAYAGHAIQQLFLKRVLYTDFPKVSFLFIHGLNPYGFKYFRRTNEENIDLNRNYGNEEIFLSTNKSYQDHKNIFHPTDKVGHSWWDKMIFYFKVGWVHVVHGKKDILQGLSGQFTDPKGTNYGGKNAAQQTTWTKELIRKHTKPYARVLHIDLHTGFGEKGKLHYYISDHITQDEYSRAKRIFKNLPLRDGTQKDFYTTNGAFDDWMWRNFEEKKIVSMVYEYGTMDSQTLKGGLKSLWAFTKENQGHYHGYKTIFTKEQTEKQFEELFNPQDLEWQKSVLKQANDSIENALTNFIEL